MSEHNTSTSETVGTATLTVENVGGISENTISLNPGVNILSGRNATNRTSLLRALGTALGGTSAQLKTDANSGSVSLELEKDSYHVEISQNGGKVDISGTPYTQREELVDLFAIILEDNKARRAVKQSGDLRGTIMEPVDTDAIEAEISELKNEKSEIINEINYITNQEKRLPQLKEQRAEIESDISNINDQIASLSDKISEFELDLEAAEDASELVDELQETRQDLSQARERLEVKEAEYDAVKEDIENIESKLENVTDVQEGELPSITNRIESLRSQQQQLDDTIASLTTIVDFNQEQLQKEKILSSFEAEKSSPTDALVSDDNQEVDCWTCGSAVKRKEISDQLDDVRDIIEAKRDERREIQTELNELQDRKQDIQQAEDEKSKLKRRKDQRQRKLDSLEDEIGEIESKRSELEQQVDTLEHRVKETKELRESELLEKSERLSQFEYERGQYKQQLDDVVAEIEEIESLPTKENLESERSQIQAQLEQKRGQIAELEQQAVKEFNEHMDELITVLGYQNIARVWIEILRPDGMQDGLSSGAVFEMHIIRENEDGAAYEDDISTLSESERELVGLVFALAGYLVHDVYEEVPFMLLDSLEAIDAKRINKLISYFSTYVPYLVVALLPEDASDVTEDTTTKMTLKS